MAKGKSGNIRVGINDDNFSKGIPFVSVVMPIRNEALFIGRSLQSILQNDYPIDYMEIFLVDGLSTDSSCQIVRQYQIDHPNIYLLENPEMIVSTALNRAIRLARGEIIVRVDGHCIIPSDYISRCVSYLQDENNTGVGGTVDTIGETPLARSIALAMSSRFGVGGSAFRTDVGKTRFVDTVPFAAYHRSTIERVGLYDEELVRNQDDEYNYRIRKFGGKILMAADIRSRYYSRSSLTGLWRQFFQYGFWKVRVLQKHPAQMQPRQFVPPAFVFILLALALISIFVPIGGFFLTGITLLYLIVDLLITTFIAANNGLGNFLPLLLIFPIIHLGYGLGFLIGLFRFIGRWSDRKGRVPSLNTTNG